MKHFITSLFFLLNFSAQAVSFTSTGVNPCRFSIGTPTPALNPTTEGARQLVERSCVGCHGLGATGGAGMFKNILDVKELVKDGWVIPGDAASSPFFKAIDSDKMPKAGKKLVVAEKKMIADWINVQKAEDWLPTVSPLPSGFVGYEDELECMVWDATKIDGLKKGDARNYEWFELTPQWNNGDPVVFKNLGMALDIALVSTSTNVGRRTAAIRPFNAEPVDPDGVIRRLFAPTANRDIEEDFDIRLLVDGKYPFRINYAVGNYKPRVVRERIQFLEAELERLTGRKQPFVRADFALNEIYNNQYYQFIGVDIKKQKLQDVEAVFGVNAFVQLFNLEADRAILKKSGVGQFNRTIDYFDSTYTLGGGLTKTVYTKTYDVIDENKAKNHLANPLGPIGQKFENFKPSAQFDFDAGEAIAINPAGEQMYFVALKDGTLISEADTRIVANRDATHPAIAPSKTPFAISTGVGCRGCHATFQNTFTEVGLPTSLKNSGLSAQEGNIIKQLFPAQVEWDAKFVSYNTAFSVVHTSYIKDPTTLSYTTEPATLATRKFLNYLTVREAAFELNVTEQDLQECFDKEAEIASAVSLTGKYGQVTRDGFVDQIDEIVDKCGYGQQVKFVRGGGKPPVTPPVRPPARKDCNYNFKNSSSFRIQFLADFGTFGSESVLLFPGDNKQFTFANEENVDGELTSVEYSGRDRGGWTGNKKLTNGKITGCRDFEFRDKGTRPAIF